jgi:PBP1b-binding outer membrane lipoprotein LpoB
MMKVFLFSQISCIVLIMVGCSAEPEPPLQTASLAKAETSVQKPSNNSFASVLDIWKIESTPPAQNELIPATVQPLQVSQPNTLAETSDLSKLPKTSGLPNLAETSDLSNLPQTSGLSDLPETSDLSKL